MGGRKWRVTRERKKGGESCGYFRGNAGWRCGVITGGEGKAHEKGGKRVVSSALQSKGCYRRGERRFKKLSRDDLLLKRSPRERRKEM